MRELVRSRALSDNLLAILCRLHDSREAVSRILSRIEQLPESQRSNALDQLLLLSRLRNLEGVIQEEKARMPIEIDMMESPIVRDYFLRGKEEGRAEGKREGQTQGEQQGARKEALTLLMRQLERRFGSIPESATRKLNEADLATLEDWSLRLLDASSLEEALRSE